jgi:hypothetical protein
MEAHDRPINFTRVSLRQWAKLQGRYDEFLAKGQLSTKTVRSSEATDSVDEDSDKGEPSYRSEEEEGQ